MPSLRGRAHCLCFPRRTVEHQHVHSRWNALGSIPTHLHTLNAAGNWENRTDCGWLQALQGCNWPGLSLAARPAKSFEMLVFMAWTELMAPQGTEPQLFTSPLGLWQGHAAEGSPGVQWVPAHNQAPPGRWVLHVANRSPKRSASPSSQAGQEPPHVGGPQAAHLAACSHLCHIYNLHNPSEPSYKPPARKRSSAPFTLQTVK